MLWSALIAQKLFGMNLSDIKDELGIDGFVQLVDDDQQSSSQRSLTGGESSANELVQDIKDVATYRELVRKQDPKVIVFSLGTSSSHNFHMKALTKIAKEYPQVAFYSFDVSDLSNLCEELGIETYPTTYFLPNGNKIDGGMETAELDDMVYELIHGKKKSEVPHRLSLATNPLDKAFGTDPKQEGPVVLERTMQLMDLAEQLINLGDLLINNGQSVTLKTLTQASRFSSTAVAKKSEKAELRLDLRTRLSIYGEQIKRSVELITTLGDEISQHEQQIAGVRKNIEALQKAQHEEKAYTEKLSIQANIPVEIQRLNEKRLKDLEEEERAATAILTGCTTNQGLLKARLQYNEAVMREMLEQKELTAKELKIVTEIIGKLDEALVRVGMKYKTTSPLVAVEAHREYQKIAVHTKLELYDEKAFRGVYNDHQEKKGGSLWELFWGLLGYKKSTN